MEGHASKYGCNFVEGEMALAASAEDWDEVRRLAQTMLPGEQRRFQRAVEKIDAIIQREIDAQESQG
jgi:hypothetical protein